MFENATAAEWTRVVLVLCALIVNIGAIFDARLAVSYVEEAKDDSLMIVAQRNLRLEHLRCFKQLLVLGLSVISLFVYSEPSTAVSTSMVVLIALSMTIAGESIWERRDRNRLRARVMAQARNGKYRRRHDD